MIQFEVTILSGAHLQAGARGRVYVFHLMALLVLLVTSPSHWVHLALFVFLVHIFIVIIKPEKAGDFNCDIFLRSRSDCLMGAGIST